MCSDTWALNASEAGSDLCFALCFFYHANVWLALEKLDLDNESSEVGIKTRSPLASLPFRGQVTKQTAVKWSINDNGKMAVSR